VSRFPDQSSADHHTLVLASASPRRRELLAYLGVPYTSIATTGEEQDIPVPAEIARELPPFPLDPRMHPTMLAWRKTQAAVADGYGGVILGADTIVAIDGMILGKPRDEADAHRMLRLLAGRTHTVYTGLALLDTRAQPRCLLDLVASDVTMTTLTDAEIAAYVATGEPSDKAGAYGIQGLGGRLVQSVAGSYTSVVGLPLRNVYRLLHASNVGELIEPEDAFQRWLADQGRIVPPCTEP
jgi:septum formation protein